VQLLRGRTQAQLLVVVLALLFGCHPSPREIPVTIIYHHPIYPAEQQDVTYTLENVSSASLEKVELYETVSKVDETGAEAPGSEVLLQSWNRPGRRVDFTKSGGYPTNSLVRYRFAVKAASSGGGCSPGTQSYDQDVKFATRPYPVPLDPAPVYVVGNQDQAFDIVFIPDEDISESDMETFRDNCLGMIREAFLDEPTTQLFRRSFNFYINPYTGKSVDYEVARAGGGDHQPPMNFDHLSFAEGRVLMHSKELTDYTYTDLRLYSTEMQNRGTILHESGHGLFGLADEYDGGVHRKVDPDPNNWSARVDAESDAPRRGKSASDARQIADVWWKLCNDQCQMNTSGEGRSRYDRPCQDRVIWAAEDNARRGAP